MVSHYTVFSDGLWTALGESCPKSCPLLIGTDAFGCPILTTAQLNQLNQLNNLLNLAGAGAQSNQFLRNALFAATLRRTNASLNASDSLLPNGAAFVPFHTLTGDSSPGSYRIRPLANTIVTAKLTQSHRQKLKDWLNTINHKWTQLVSSMHCRPNAHQLLHSHGSTLDCSLYGSVYGHCGLDQSSATATRSDTTDLNEPIKCWTPKVSRTSNVSSLELPNDNGSSSNRHNASTSQDDNTANVKLLDCGLSMEEAKYPPRLVQPFVCVDYNTGNFIF